MPTTTTEHADVVIVGSRCAGTALPAVLARAGRKVIVLEKNAFPADTLSTHVFFPMGVNELVKMGALERLLALNPSRMTHLQLDLVGISKTEKFRPVGDIDYAISVPRIAQDIELVAAARDAGADIREQCSIYEVVKVKGRAIGVRYYDADGDEHVIAAKLVVGADGRHSTVAYHVGEWEPYRRSRNGRGMVWRYMTDPASDTELGRTMWEGRTRDTVAFAFPSTPKGNLLVLFMGPRSEVAEARSDAEGYWARKVSEFPQLQARIANAPGQTPVQSTEQTHAYFRRSSGAGWALIGDAAHFKDPVLGQGMRDAMWMGRTLGEHVVDVLDNPKKLDKATREWERARDREVLPTYHYGNLETRIPAVPTDIIATVVGNTSGTELSDIHQRIAKPHDVYSLSQVTRALVRTLPKVGTRPRKLLHVAEITGVELTVRAEWLAARSLGIRVPGTGVLVGEHRDEKPWAPAPRRITNPTRPKPESRKFTATITQVTPLSADVKAFELARTDGRDWPKWTPGSHLDLLLASGKVRQYSLCGSANDRSTVRIAVLREADGRGGSVEIHRLGEGAMVTVSAPRNNFELHPAAENLFIAGGIGVTPLIPMIEALEAAGTAWHLLFLARSAANMPFGKELAARYPDKVTLHADNESGTADLAAWLGNLDEGAAVYCCGPSGLMDAVVELAQQRGGITTHIERFVASHKQANEDRSFQVELAFSNATVDVPVGMTMLDAIRTVVPDLPAACESGLCGSCEIAVICGRPDHRDDIITDRTRADVIYPCVSRSLDPTLTIDV